jgi:uncharacterized protein YvpB
MVDTSAQVLGLSYFGPVAGSPLIPPEVITFYFIIFFALLAVIYFFLHKKKKPVLIWHKIKLFVVVALALKIFFIVGGGLIAAYWLLPTPSVQTTTPLASENNYSTKNKIEVIFDRPVSRSSLEKSIEPAVPGVWVFENSLYSTHFYRKVTFYPTQSLAPDVKYTIALSNIKNPLKISKPYSYNFSFKTQPSPHIVGVTPVSGTGDVAITTPITIALSDKNDSVSEFDFEINPSHSIAAKLDAKKKSYTLSPSTPFKQGTKYTLTVKKTDIILNIPTNTVVQRSNTTQEYEGSFTTREAPGILQFTPAENNVSANAPIVISFSEPMDKKSVEENFSITPLVLGNFTWKDDQSLTFAPTRLANETKYTVTVKKGAKAQGSGFLEQDVVKTFTTIGHVKVAQFAPTDGWFAVGIANQIKTTFDQEVDKKSAESKFSISPQVPGTFSWDSNTMIFTPSQDFIFSTKYKVTIASGVKSIRGLDANKNFEMSFTTQEQTVKLAVPAYLQQHALSCEIAALRMALAYKGHLLSEETLLEQIGVDPTPHSGNIWGNPHNAFVGNVDGRQMVDGYGVYWNPIARVARMYGSATEFQGWGITQLTQALSEGNAVVIWTYSSGGWPTSWNTPDGQNIFAYRDEHAVTAVGYVGPANNPSQLIINDPLTGQVYWQRAFFDKKWASFSNAGVVVY